MPMHPFHMVEKSPWPLLMSLMMLSLVNNFFLSQKLFLSENYILMISISLIMMICFQWWRDVIRESTFQGCHTKQVFSGLKLGMILFILSEVMFFFSFFWCFFHMSLSPDVFIGMMWPPKGVVSFNPFMIPLLNTLILISSGVSVTWSHHAILNGDYKESMYSLLITIMLGMYFTAFQAMEYWDSSFNISDSVYGSVFFVMTGFHGFHVLMGTVFLLVNYFRMIFGHFSSLHHLGYEMAIWYWHFVDIVWLFLFVFVYWWYF